MSRSLSGEEVGKGFLRQRKQPGPGLVEKDSEGSSEFKGESRMGLSRGAGH